MSETPRTKLSRPDLLVEATKIANLYKSQGHSLTLRPLYYQLVAGGVSPNSQQDYDRLGATISEARLDGDFDPYLLVDRGREAGASAHVDCKLGVNAADKEAASYLRALPYWTIRSDRWFGQSTHVSVWVEKDALSGVFEKPCKDLGVGLFACKGYPSHSALWEWLGHLGKAADASRTPVVDDDDDDGIEPVPLDEAVVLYFGDHDPDGWAIPRSAESVLNRFVETYGLDVPPIRFERIALNMEQIRSFNPPPFPAKISSSRYASYVDEHGTTDAWELDALRPQTLIDLIRSNVESYFDADAARFWTSRVDEKRHELTNRILAPGWTRKAMGVDR